MDLIRRLPQYHLPELRGRRRLTQMGQRSKIYQRISADNKKTVNFMTKAELDAVSEKIIGAAYKVSNSLGAGFLEKVHPVK